MDITHTAPGANPYGGSSISLQIPSGVSKAHLTRSNAFGRVQRSSTMGEGVPRSLTTDEREPRSELDCGNVTSPGSGDLEFAVRTPSRRYYVRHRPPGNVDKMGPV